MADLQVGNNAGVAAAGNQSALLASLVADNGSDNQVNVDDARKLNVGQRIDILVRATGSSSGGAVDRVITNIADTATAAVATTVAGVAAVNEQQTLTQGGSGLTSYTLTYAGQTTGAILAAASNADIKATLELLSNIDLVTVTGTEPKVVEFQGTLAATNVAQMTSTPTGGTGTLTVTTTRAGVAPVNEQETITIVADAGFFTVTYSAETSAHIPWNEDEDTAEDILEAVSTIGVGNISVSKASNVYTLEFIGALAGTNVTQVTTDATHLSMGTTVVTYTGADVDPDNTYGIYLTGTYGDGPSKTNVNGGLSDRQGFNLNSLDTIDSMRARLIEINETYYTDTVLNMMTENDMVYAIRVNDAESSIQP